MTTVERVRVGEVLALRRRPVAIDPMEQYRLIGVYSFGKGIFHREQCPGSELGDYRFFSVEPGDLVMSNIQAWEGAIGCASKADAGAVGTHRFLTYVPSTGRIDTNWARWFFLSDPGRELIRKAAPGTTMRNRTLAIQRFEELEIPLPPLSEQRAVARRLDRLERASNEIARLSTYADERLVAFAVSTSSRPDLADAAKARLGWRRVRLGTVMERSADTIKVQPDVRYPNFGIRSFGRGTFVKPDIDGAETSATTLYRVHAGQFIYSRLFAFEGAYASVPPELDGYFVSNEFPSFDTDPERLDARWLATMLRSPDRWAELASSSKGLGVRRQRVPVESVLGCEMWLPPHEQQATMLHAVAQLGAIGKARARNEERVNALLPAALNQAFASLL